MALKKGIYLQDNRGYPGFMSFGYLLNTLCLIRPNFIQLKIIPVPFLAKLVIESKNKGEFS